MSGNQGRLSVVGVLAGIAFAATAIALALQTYFGRLQILILLGPILAVIGAGAFALWLKKQR